jgi:hypothetical protein
MAIGSSEFARRAGISERRVQQLIHGGQIRASKVASRWLIEESELNRRRPVGRPMSHRMSRALLVALSGKPLGARLSPSEKSRIRRHVSEIKASEKASDLISSWLAERAKVNHFQIAPMNIQLLHQEKLLRPSGVSDPQLGIFDANYFEGYVESGNLSQIKRKYLLVPSEKPNVVLREALLEDQEEIVFGLSLADLAEHHESRAEIKLQEILRKI